MKRRNHRASFLRCLAWALLSFLGVRSALAQDTVCARVVMQLDQQLTLEREGFEARLGITNGLPTSLDNIQVTLKFLDANNAPVVISTDSAPDASGKFYYRIQTGYTGVTSVASGASAKIAYLIVPALGAAGDSAQGTLYYVGATVKYTSDGADQTEEIAPDYIYVKPMPQLELQYFLPGPVYGDDPLTTTVVESPIPFPLGVRVINHSAFATAKSVKIDSGQPEITENKQGLLEAFQINDCHVNGQPAQASLLVDFGDIAPQRSSLASWDMTTSLSGTFVKFTAQVSHAPEFGGELTSLIPEDAISTHRLIGQVLVDLPGRDAVPDFLATDAMAGDITAPRIYESDTESTSQLVDYFPPASSAVVLGYDGTAASLAVDTTSSVMYVRAASPVAAVKAVKAVRSDGKVLPTGNAWIDKTEDASGIWHYWLNLFDTSTAPSQTYTLSFSELVLGNQPPTLTVIGGPSFAVVPGQPLNIGVIATDSNGTVPILSTGMLPFGAAFVDQTGGKGLFSWTPTASQLGSFTIQFKAANGSATVTANAFVQVVASTVPSYKSWRQVNWPLTDDPLIVGPNANPDGDQLNNLLEYAIGADPNRADDSALPEVGISTVNGLRYLTLTYQMRSGDPTLLYEVIAAGDLSTPLVNWTVQTQTETASQTNLPAGMTRVTVRDSVPIENGPRRYLKLRVTQTGTP